MFTAPDGTTYRIADAHAHIYKTKIAEKASQVIGRFYETPMAEDQAVSDQLIVRGRQIGVDTFLVCSAATAESQIDSINRFVADECAAHPEFIGLGTSHPEAADPEAVVQQICDLGLRGIKLHPDFQQFDIDDARMIPLYRAAAEAGIVVLFHVGDERPRNHYSAPEHLLRVLDKVPDLRVHAAHFGCCRIADRRPIALAGCDIMYDTSSALMWFDVECIHEVIEALGVDHLMWGTDFPMWDHAAELERFFNLGLSVEDNKKVLWDNFARFYGVE